MLSFLLAGSLLPASSLAQGPMGNLPGSLYGQTVGHSLIERRTAKRVGDVLTVVVNEVSRGQFTASTTTNRTEAATAASVSVPVLDVFAGPMLGSVLGKGVSKIAKSLLGGGTVSGNQKGSGGGSANNGSSYTATMTVTVVEVDANGNLHVEGRRQVQVNKETQTMVLTGIVRPDDVTDANTVPSAKIGNADIRTDGKGAVADKTRRGLLGKIVDWLF